jgi:hypothetical protein
MPFGSGEKVHALIVAPLGTAQRLQPSLRDKNHSPIETPRTKSALMEPETTMKLHMTK